MASRIVGRENGEVEALARAHSRWARVQAMESPGAWIVRVATNLALEQVRKMKADADPPL